MMRVTFSVAWIWSTVACTTATGSWKVVPGPGLLMSGIAGDTELEMRRDDGGRERTVSGDTNNGELVLLEDVVGDDARVDFGMVGLDVCADHRESHIFYLQG